LGQEFFRQVPERPGVYLMHDAADTVVYVGKAKNLRKRLGSYRVANPERLKRRQLRLLQAVARVELQECADETSALARESELLLSLRPRFNRAGTWPQTPRFLTWRVTVAGFEIAVVAMSEVEGVVRTPIGSRALRGDGNRGDSLACHAGPVVVVCNPSERGLAGIPMTNSEDRKAEGEEMSEGWLAGLVEPLPLSNVAMLPRYGVAAEHFHARRNRWRLCLREMWKDLPHGFGSARQRRFIPSRWRPERLIWSAFKFAIG